MSALSDHSPTPHHYWLTGASSGIGRELALQLAAQGHRVYISARSAAALQALAAEAPGQLIPLPCDVSDDAQMATVFEQLPETQRPQWLDGLIAGAGVCEYVDLPVLDTAMCRRVADVNYFGVINACAAALPLLPRSAQDGSRGRPVIAGLCSMSVYTAFPRAEAYGAAKAAMAYFLDSLRCDIGRSIDVCLVYPGFVSTPMTAGNDFPMPFCISAQEAAGRTLAGLARRHRAFAFPWQLHWILKLAAAMPALWYGVIMPRMRRNPLSAGAPAHNESTR
jgi:NAD(P)-dependent dehydrogenase (short-subunit alcohol dehydrogenase family)